MGNETIILGSGASSVVRRFIVLVGLLASLSSWPSVGAQADTGTIIFRSYYCPYGYAEEFYPDACDPATAGVSLWIDGNEVGSEPIGVGEAIFVVLPGHYSVSSSSPGHWTNPGPTKCRTTGGPNSDDWMLESGETIECEQMIFPDSGRAGNPPDELDLSLTIRVRTCDLAIDQTDFYAACFGNIVADRSVWISSPEFETEVVTDAEGNVTIPIPDYTFTFAPQGVAPNHQIWRFCTSAAHPGIPMQYPLDVRFHTEPVTCDVYLVPTAYDLSAGTDTADTGTIEVHYRRCPAGYDQDAYYRDCHANGIGDAAIDLGRNGNLIGRGYTDDKGNVTFRVAPGIYDLPPAILVNPDDHIAVFCSVEGDTGALVDYPVAVNASDRIVCDLYLLPV